MSRGVLFVSPSFSPGLVGGGRSPSPPCCCARDTMRADLGASRCFVGCLRNAENPDPFGPGFSLKAVGLPASRESEVNRRHKTGERRQPQQFRDDAGIAHRCSSHRFGLSSPTTPKIQGIAPDCK